MAPIPDVTAPDETAALNPQSCIERYDPAVDYFPEKAAPRYAERFSVTYHRHYKKVTVSLPAGEESFRYLLLQCGAPPPEGVDPLDIIEVPVKSLVTTSTTELSHLVELDLVDRLSGHDELDYVSSPEIRQRIAAGQVVEVGNETKLNFEMLVEVDPDLVLAASLGSFEQGVFGQVQKAGIRVAHVPSFLESRPLGRAEWLLFTSLFFNREGRAMATFEGVAERYEALAEKGRAAEDRPSVLTAAPIGDTWHIPGGESFVARLAADAGGDYLWSDLATAGSVPLAIESVYDRALEADFWIHPGLWRSLEEIAGVDERFATLKAFAERRVYANDARMNDVGRRQGVGGNDYWETGTVRPDLVLADLLKIFHPELMPEHALVFHRRL